MSLTFQVDFCWFLCIEYIKIENNYFYGTVSWLFCVMVYRHLNVHVYVCVSCTEDGRVMKMVQGSRSGVADTLPIIAEIIKVRTINASPSLIVWERNEPDTLCLCMHIIFLGFRKFIYMYIYSSSLSETNRIPVATFSLVKRSSRGTLRYQQWWRDACIAWCNEYVHQALAPYHSLAQLLRRAWCQGYT